MQFYVIQFEEDSKVKFEAVSENWVSKVGISNFSIWPKEELYQNVAELEDIIKLGDTISPENCITFQCSIRAIKDTYEKAANKVRKIVTDRRGSNLSDLLLTTDSEHEKKTRHDRMKKRNYESNSDSDEPSSSKKVSKPVRKHGKNTAPAKPITDKQKQKERELKQLSASILRENMQRLNNTSPPPPPVPLRTSPRIARNHSCQFTPVRKINQHVVKKNLTLEHHGSAQTSRSPGRVVASTSTTLDAAPDNTLNTQVAVTTFTPPVTPSVITTAGGYLTEAVFKTYFNHLLTNQVSMKNQIKDIEKKLLAHTGGPPSDVPDNWVLYEEVLHSWPLKNLDAFKKQEQLLADEVTFTLLTKHFKNQNDKKAYDKMARSLMNAMLTVDLQQHFIFAGGNSNSNSLKLEDTRSYKLVRESVNASFPGDTSSEIRACIQIWLQKKSDRRKRQVNNPNNEQDDDM